MENPFGITLDDASLRWAAAEGVPESVIAAVRLLGDKSVDEVVARLSPDELQQVINIVGRSPSAYPPGVYAALKDKRDLAASSRADGPPRKAAPKGQTIPRNVAAQKRARAARKPAALRQHAVDGEKGASPPKSETPTGTRAETARRRMNVEELMKAGLSIRTISAGTGIPRSSVHRAMRAVARAEAKKQIAIAEIANELLGKRLRHSGGGRP